MASNLRNEDVIDHFKTTKNTKITTKFFTNQLHEQSSDIPIRSLNNKISKIISDYRKLNKSNKSTNYTSNLQQFLSQPLVLPTITPKTPSNKPHNSQEFCQHETVAMSLTTELKEKEYVSTKNIVDTILWLTT